MNRTGVVLLVLATGCAPATAPSPARNAELAVAAARAVVKARKPAPPKPVVPDGKCERCLGLGYIGDNASIREVCPACKGTGKQ